MSAPDLSIVVPVYGSEECLRALVDAIDASMTAAGRSHEVVLVNDGSKDASWGVIRELCGERSHVVGVDLRRNFGQDNAIMTGLRLARGECVAIMDDDLQHDPAYLAAMADELGEGYDVVYADFPRKRQALWKNFGSWFNGRVAEWVIDKPRGVYLSPYKVIRGEVVKEIVEYTGPTPYVDGLLFQATARVGSVPVEHRERYAGSGHYGLLRSIGVWTRLAFSFSVLPLRLVTLLGAALAGLAMLLVGVTIAYRLGYPEDFGPYAVGWASLIVTQLFVAGVQMIFFGIIGEYVGRSYLTIARKPQTGIAELLDARLPDAPREQQ